MISSEDIFQTAVDLYGESNQAEKAIEECSELITALIKFSHGRATDEQVIDEIADVIIMSNQLRIIFGQEDVDERIKYKLERLLQMMGRV
jgi:hypothetical protein